MTQIPMSMGDEPGAMMGVVSQTVKAPTRTVTVVVPVACASDCNAASGVMPRLPARSYDCSAASVAMPPVIKRSGAGAWTSLDLPPLQAVATLEPSTEDDAGIGGGAAVYDAAMPYADEQVISEIPLAPENLPAQPAIPS